MQTININEIGKVHAWFLDNINEIKSEVIESAKHCADFNYFDVEGLYQNLKGIILVESKYGAIEKNYWEHRRSSPFAMMCKIIELYYESIKNATN